MVCPEAITHHDAATIAKRLLHRLAQPMFYNGNRISITASIGVTTSGQDRDSHALIDLADTAMYQAKKAAPGHYKFIK